MIVQTIYSLTVNFIEKFLSGKNTRAGLESLKDSIIEERFTDSLSLIDSLILKSGLEIHDLNQRRFFIAELNFIAAIIDYQSGEFSKAKQRFIKCLAVRHLYAYSSLFLASCARKRKNYDEAQTYITQCRESYHDYKYFDLLELKILFDAGEYENVSAGAKKLIENLSALDREVKLLPAFEFNIIETVYIKKFIESAFSLNDFLFDILFTSAESNFYIENYETAFEYYKEASFGRAGGETEAACLYKMACCKMRISDFITARGLLEKIIDISGGLSYYNCVFLDLANLYEYHFCEPASAIEALIGYLKSSGGEREIIIRLSSLLYEAKRYNEALNYFNLDLNAGFTDDLELSHIAAKCHYSLENYSKCMEIITPFLFQNETLNDIIVENPENFELILLAAKTMIMLDDFEGAALMAARIEKAACTSADKFAAADFMMFYNSLFAAPYVMYIKNEGVSVFKGFIKIAGQSSPIDDLEAFKNFISGFAVKEFITVISKNVIAKDFLLLSRVLESKIIIYEKHLDFINDELCIISPRDNPVEYKHLEPDLKVFCAFVRLLCLLNIDNMPDLFINSGSYSDGADDGQYSGILRFYEYYKNHVRKFGFYYSYLQISKGGGENSDYYNEKSHLWPFLINYKNIDVFKQHSDDERERVFVNSCADIFLYNFFRERKNEIDGEKGVHIFVEPGKTTYMKAIVEFILKKLGYLNICVLECGDLNDIFCIKKVNELLSVRVSNESESFSILSLILIMSSGARAFNVMNGRYKKPGFTGRVKFSGCDCDYLNCAEKKMCKINEIIEFYNKTGPAFIISPFSNFFFMNSKIDKPLPFIDYIQIFTSAPGFYQSSLEYYEESVEIGTIAAQIDKITLSDDISADNVFKLQNLSDLLKSLNNFFDGFFNIYDGTVLIKKICSAAAACKKAVKSIRAGMDGYSQLFKLFDLSERYLKFLISIQNNSNIQRDSEYRIKMFLRNDRYSVNLVMSDAFKAGDIIFDRFIKKIFFVSEEDSGGFYEKKLSGLIKFFKKIDLTEKYFKAAAFNSSIMVQPENGSNYKDIINKFIYNSKKAAVFFLNSACFMDHDFVKSNISAEPAYGFINLPSSVESELINLDCVVINYHYKNKEHAHSILTMLKNIIIKYNSNIFWMIVSTELYENIFARGSDYFNIGGLKYYLNEIEYINAFSGDKDGLKFLESSSSSAYYSAFGNAGILDKYDVLRHDFHSKIYKLWLHTYENIIEPGLKTLIAESGKQAEKSLFIITSMALYTGFKKRIVILYGGHNCEKSRLLNFLYSCELLNDAYINERHRIILPAVNYRENLFLEKDFRTLDALLINYQPLSIIFNSASFNVIDYIAWQNYSSSFDRFLNIIPVCRAENYLTCNSYNDFIDALVKTVGEEIYKNETYYIVCIPAESAEFLYERMKITVLKEAGAGLYCISYENAASVIYDIIEMNNASRINVLFLSTVYNETDMRLALARISNYNSAAVMNVFNYMIPAADNYIKMPEILYTEAVFAAELIYQSACRSFIISLDEFSDFLPVSIFIKNAASRCLALLSESGIIKVSSLAKTGYESSDYFIDGRFLSELSDSGILKLFFKPAEEEKYDFINLIHRGLVAVSDKYELIDRFCVVFKDAVIIKIKINNDNVQAGLEYLKKMAKVRKNMLRCLYDIEGFREGRDINLPLSDFHSLSINDYFYMREFAFLYWHKTCLFDRNETNTPRIKRIFSQIQMERVTENIEHDLNLLYLEMLAIEKESGLSSINKLSILLDFFKSSDGRPGYKFKDVKSPSGLLKLLKHLFLYGLINLETVIPFETENYLLVIEKNQDKNNFDYKNFIQAYDKMYKI